MKRNLIKKLNLKRETLRTLKSHELERAQGAESAVVVCFYTPACVAQTQGPECIFVDTVYCIPTNYTIITTSLPTTSIGPSYGY